ncbi:MAG: hypothetical protein AAF716_10245 [Cyanobacteria bacterium P01_D01_bin.1]
MSYDSKTYGQSPFGNVPTPNDEAASQPATEKEQKPKAGAEQSSLSPPAWTVPSVSSEQIADLADTETVDAGKATTKRKSRTSSRSSASKSSASKTSTAKVPRKGKKAQAASKAKAAKASSAAQTEPETAEEAIARRFLEEDRSAYLSLLYKTAVSGLVWAVLRLVRHQVSERAIAIINVIIHPVLVSMLALVGTIGLTFWLRHLLKDLALHTQQLTADAEATDSKNYRPTLDIVGDSLEYNPILRKQLSRLFNVASILICTLISYVMTSLLLPWG